MAVFFLSPSEQQNEAITELLGGSDRAGAIVGTTMIETRLEAAIKARVNLPKITKEMFRPMGPLGSLSAKIHLGFMLGLYGEAAWRELDTIRDIRNWFAHHLDDATFGSNKIGKLCMKLELVKRHVSEAMPTTPPLPFWVRATEAQLALPRYRFNLSVSLYTVCLEHYPDVLK
jgi:hypothetical protein